MIYIPDSYKRDGFLDFDETDEKHILYDNGELVIANGKLNATFPEDMYCIFREDRDHITFEFNYIKDESIFGNYVLNPNNDNTESIAYFKQLKITFLSENKDDLPSDTEICNMIPMTCSSEYAWSAKYFAGALWDARWVTKDPFGLSGYFLFETYSDSHDFGYYYIPEGYQ